MDITINKEGSWLKHPALNILLFTVVIFSIRIFLRGPLLLLDEAEQVVMAQELLPGYSGQPPLYTWLQYEFFKFLGVNLFSLVLLKCSLIFGSIYFFYLICRIHCDDQSLVWCAVCSWALIPSIGLDLVKDNTHSILVLFIACVTWYWFLRFEHTAKLVWYSFWGVIVTCGLLAKFNYLIFLTTLLLSALTIQEFRARLLDPYIKLSFLIIIIFTSPYFLWLLIHSDLGFSSIYKLTAQHLSSLQGINQLAKVFLLFAAPSFCLMVLFFPNSKTDKLKSSNRLLMHYHLLSFPVLLIITFSAGFRHFETRWLVPILFLSPLLYLSRVRASNNNNRRKITMFLMICLMTQFIYFSILVYNGHGKQAQSKQISLNKIVNLIKKNSNPSDYIVSDSYWLLGNLALGLSNRVWLIQPTKEVLPRGRSLVFWQGKEAPYWINLFARTSLLTELNLILETPNQLVIGGQACGYR